MKIESYFLEGNSFPVVFQQGNIKYFVKLKGGMSGEYSLLNEWFCAKVAQAIGLPVLSPHWISLTPDIDYRDIYIEVRELIEKSFGLNIGYQYLENVHNVNFHELKDINKDLLSDMFLLDLAMINIDRTHYNTNILKSGNDIFVSDFDSCMFFNEIASSTVYSENERILQCLKANPLYQYLVENRIGFFVEKLSNVSYQNIIDEIPAEVLSNVSKEQIVHALVKRREDNWNIEIMLSKIGTIELESEEQKNKRIAENRNRLITVVNNTDNV